MVYVCIVCLCPFLTLEQVHEGHAYEKSNIKHSTETLIEDYHWKACSVAANWPSVFMHTHKCTHTHALAHKSKCTLELHYNFLRQCLKWVQLESFWVWISNHYSSNSSSSWIKTEMMSMLNQNKTKSIPYWTICQQTVFIPEFQRVPFFSII